MLDYAMKRKNMVESQVRTSDVTDRRITAAMQGVAREDFVPQSLKDLAYIDDDLEVAPGRTLMAPRTFARLLQLADVSDSDKVLIVGGLAGYSTLIIARLAREVVTLDSDAAMTSAAQTAIASAGLPMATAVNGPLVAGWANGAPYDVIFVEGGIAIEPGALMAQLADDGRLVAIDLNKVGRAAVMRPVRSEGPGALSKRAMFDAGARCLPGFERPKTFAF